MIKADFIEEKDLKKIQELKKFLTTRRMRISTGNYGQLLVSFNNRKTWLYIDTNYSNRSWDINKTMTIKI